MSNDVPRCPYVYQPDPARGSRPAAEQKIFGVGGPGTDHLAGRRYTRAEAERVVDMLVIGRGGMFGSFLGDGQ